MSTRANIGLNLPQRYKKGVMSVMNLTSAPFYRCDEVAPEGAPVVIDTAKDNYVKMAVPGSSSAGIFGILAQKTYDPALLGELAGYEFHNNTKERIGGTIGVFTGQGWFSTINYAGTVAQNDLLYPGPSGVLSATQTGSDASVGVAEEGGVDGATYIRVRASFTLV